MFEIADVVHRYGDATAVSVRMWKAAAGDVWLSGAAIAR